MTVTSAPTTHREPTERDRRAPAAPAPRWLVELADDRGAVLGPVHLDALAELDRLLRAGLEHVEAAGSVTVDLASVRRSVATATLDLLVHAGSRTLLTDFHDRLDDGSLGEPDPSGTRRFERFLAETASPDGRAALRDRHPGWARLSALIIERRARMVTECLSRLADETHDLSAVLGSRPTRVLDVVLTSGDSHAGGRSVMMVDTDAGRVVHKPRSLAADVLVGRVLRRLGQHVGADAARLPRTLDRGSHGWQEHVAPRPCADDDEVRTYYRRLGSLLATFRALGTTDIHYENLLACGPDPMVIDLETLLRRPTRPGSTGLPAVDEAVGRAMGASVFGTMILPMNYAGAAFDVDLSAMGVVEEQVSDRFASWQIADAGTDAIRYDRVSTPIRHEANLVRDAAGPVDSRDHDEHVVDGFTRAWDALCRHADVLEPARATADDPGDLGVRQVLRPTALYWRFLEASLHPVHLDDPDGRERLLRRLGPTPGLPEGVGRTVLDHEVAALLDGDIPLLEAPLGSRDLRCDHRSTVADAYDEPLAGVLLDNLDAVRPEAQHFETSVIRSALVTTSPDVWRGGVRLGDPGHEVFADADPWGAATRIGQLVDRLAVRDRDRAAWVVARLRDERRLQVARSDHSLFEGGMLAVALEALSRAGGDPRHSVTARAAVDALLDDPEPWVTGSADSAWTGGPSTLAVAARVHGRTPRTRELAEKVDLPGAIADRLARTGVEATTPDDLLLGLAGQVRLHLALLRDLPDLALPVADEVLEAALTRLGGSGAPGTGSADGDGSGGMAHGRPGIAMVRAELAVAMGRDDDVAAERTRLRGPDGDPLAGVVDLARPTQDARAALGWCRGLSGATLATARTMRSVGIDPTEARHLLRHSLAALLSGSAAPPSGDVSLCHGSGGVIASLLELGVLLDDPALGDAAADLARRTVASAHAHGWSGGVDRSAGLLTGWLGLSGFLHALVQLRAPATPSALALDLGGTGGRR